MLSNKMTSHLENWKELSEGVSITHFASVHGKKNQIYVKKIDSKSLSRVKIFLFHDLSSYHGRFSQLIEWFQAQNPHVSFVMMDFIGHGLSSGTRGHIPDFKILSLDAAELYRIIDQDFGKPVEEKWVALGHGMGALAILDLMSRVEESGQKKIDQLIFSNFVLNFSSPLLQKENQFLKKFSALHETLRHIRPVEIYRAEEVLTHAHEQTMYMEDPLINRRPTYQTFENLLEKTRNVYQDAYFLDKPTLLLKSESPYLCNNGVDSFSKGFKKELLTEKKYSNLRHDLYNEKDNLKVFNDILEWVGR